MCKKILSLIIIPILIICSFPSLFAAAETASSAPTLVYGDMGNNLVQFGGTYLDSTFSQRVNVTDGSAPVKTYLQHKRNETGADGKGVATGFRHNSRYQAVKGEIWVVEYWVRAYAPEGSTKNPEVSGTMNYTQENNSTSSEIPDINGDTDYKTLENGKWHKRYQIFQIPESTTGLSSGDKNGVRFVLSSGKYFNQITQVGDLTMYTFPENYSYDNYTGVDAVKKYIDNASLSAIYNSGALVEGFSADKYDYTIATGSLGSITAESENVYADIEYDTSENGKVVVTSEAYPYNNGGFTKENASTVLKSAYTVAEISPVESLFADNYDLTKWEVGSKGNAIGGAPVLMEEDGKIALKYDTKDSVSNVTYAAFRAQTLPNALKNTTELVKGDRVYIKFKAKAYSRYDNACQINFGVEKLTSAGGSDGWLTDTVTVGVDGVWRTYYAILNVTATTDIGARIRMAVGYYGQTTYLTDIEIYKCTPGVDDKVIINYLNNEPEFMIKTDALSLSGANYFGTGINTGILETITTYDVAPPVNFEKAYKFTSSDHNNTVNTNNDIHALKARLNTGNVYSGTADAGDMLLLTFWAYGEYTGSDENGQAYMRPEVQASTGGSGGKSAGYLNADGKVVSTHVAVPSEWKRYAYILQIPESTGYDMQINWYIGKTHQSITFAGIELYNLGAVSAEEALSYLDDTDGKLFFKSRPMELNEDGSYTAYAGNDEDNFTASDFSAKGINRFTSSRVVSYPDSVGENGVIEFIAPNGTTQEVAFTIEELEKVKTDGRFYDSTKKAIIKLDDLWGNCDDFAPTVEMIKSHGMKLALGVSGEKWVNASAEEWAKLKEWSDDPDIEIWHHGYEHATEEYSTNSYDRQLESFKNTMELMASHGIELTSFGSPLNNSTLVTAQMIYENFPEITNTMLSADNSIYQSGAIINFDNRVDIEVAKEAGQNKTGVLNLEAFKTNIDKANFKEVIVVQGHAAMWDAQEVAELDIALSYMEQKGIVTVLPSEHASALKSNEEINEFGTVPVKAEAILKSGVSSLQKFEVIFAVYYKADNELAGISKQAVELEAFEEKTVSLENIVPKDGGEYYVKVFSWDSIDETTPLGIADVSGK